jgi:mannosyltransferase
MPLPEVRVEQNANPAHPQPMAARWISCLILGLLVGVGAVLRFAHLTSKPFWFDECFSVELARLDWRNFLHVIWWREANMALYYVLLRGWLHLGQSEFLIRSLSAFFAIATIPAIYWLTRQFFDRQVALIAAALFTFNAYNVRYAQEARSYALFVLLVVLSSGFLLSWVREPTRRNRLAFVTASIVSIYAHLYALLLFAAQWLGLRCFGRPDSTNQASGESDARLGRAWKVIAIGALPLLIFVAKTGAGPIRWIHRPGIHDLLDFWRQISGGSSWLLPLIYFLLCLAAVAPLGKRLLKCGQSSEVWACQFLLVSVLFPVLLTFFLSFFRPVFLTRFLMFCQPALIILAALGLARLRRFG